MSSPPAAPSPRRRATLRIRVEEARGLLPLGGAGDDADTPCHVTLRLAPHEARHSRSTRDARRGVEPVRARAHASERARAARECTFSQAHRRKRSALTLTPPPARARFFLPRRQAWHEEFEVALPSDAVAVEFKGARPPQERRTFTRASSILVCA
jgi:hypothetical protein